MIVSQKFIAKTTTALSFSCQSDPGSHTYTLPLLEKLILVFLLESIGSTGTCTETDGTLMDKVYAVTRDRPWWQKLVVAFYPRWDEDKWWQVHSYKKTFLLPCSNLHVFTSKYFSFFKIFGKISNSKENCNII